MAGHKETSESDLDEGGPVKNFLEHLEDFRWVLIKCVTTVALGMIAITGVSNGLYIWLRERGERWIK